MRRADLFLGLVAGAAVATPAHAADDGFEFWLNPSVSTDFDDNTGVELETAQRFRSVADGRADTYFARLWLNQDLSDKLTLSGAVEQRINDPGRDETRLMQQLSGKFGVIRTRLRLEQRFVDEADRMGLRLRPRLGVALPLGTSGRWTAKADAELFSTLRSTSVGGDDGLTGLRTHIGATRKVNDRLSVGVVYLRQHDIRSGRPDTVGHAQLVTIDRSL